MRHVNSFTNEEILMTQTAPTCYISYNYDDMDHDSLNKLIELIRDL